MSFQRMIAIPQEEYRQLTTMQNVHQPLAQQFNNLERDYNESERISDPYKRMMVQSETLEEMKDLKERMREYIEYRTPKPYRHRARALVHSIQDHIQLNERGEIMDRNGKVIENSHLQDLVQHAVREKRRHFMVPIGWQEFLHVLRDRNIPRSSLSNDTLKELERYPYDTTSEAAKLPERQSRRRTRVRVSREKRLPSLTPVKTRKVTVSRAGRPQKQSKRYPSTDFLKHF